MLESDVDPAHSSAGVPAGVSVAAADIDLAQLLERCRYRGPKVSWADIVGHAGAIRELRIVATQVTKRALAERMGITTFTRGLLISGPPGTGKTLLAKAIANEADRPVFVIPSAEVDAALIRRVYEHLASTPCIIVWDEADMILRGRWSPRAVDSGRTAAAFCSALDGMQSADAPITIGLTASDEFMLDPSALRAGRLTTKVSLSLPTREERSRMFEHALASVILTKPLDLDRAADRSDGLSGADIVSIVNIAVGLALQDGLEALDPAHFDESLMRRNRLAELPEPSAADLRRMAIHEAGHAIAAALFWGPWVIVSVSLRPGEDHAARTVYSDDHRITSQMDRKTLRQAASVAMAGLVAEELAYGIDGVSSGGASDISQATQLLRYLNTVVGASALVGPIDLDALERGNASDHGSEAMRTLAWHVIAGDATNRHEEVRRLLRPRRSAIEGLADLLLSSENRTLSGTELAVAFTDVNVRQLDRRWPADHEADRGSEADLS